MIPEPAPISYVSNRDGMWWNHATIPPKRHRCKPQTTVRLTTITVHRCACGARKFGKFSRWEHRNSR